MKSTKSSTKKITILFLIAFFCFMMEIGFDVYAVSTEPVFIKLSVMQSFSSQDKILTSSIEKLTYEFRPLEKDNPMPSETIGEKYEITIIGNQIIEIGELIYTHAGIYNYQLKVVKSDYSRDYKCDITEYTIIVCVRNEGNGQLGKPEVIIKNNNGQKSGILVYNYVSINKGGSNITGEMPQTGDHSQREIWIVLFVASTLFIILLLIKRKKDFEQKE